MLTEEELGQDDREDGHTSWIWKERQTVGMEVGNREGGDGEEDGEAVGDAVGVGVVESNPVCAVSSLGKRGVRGGTSSTSTSE